MIDKICQENNFLKAATFFIFHASNLCKGSVVRMFPLDDTNSMKNCILRGKGSMGYAMTCHSMSS